MLQRYLLERLIRIADVERILARLLDTLGHLAPLIHRLGLDLSGFLSRDSTRVLVGLVQEGHVILVGRHFQWCGGCEMSYWS